MPELAYHEHRADRGSKAGILDGVQSGRLTGVPRGGLPGGRIRLVAGPARAEASGCEGLEGLRRGGVLEVVEDHEGDTYRAVYTVKLAGAVYVLHAFQKKAKKGIKTPMAEMNVIRQRLKAAEDHHEERRAEEERRRSRGH